MDNNEISATLLWERNGVQFWRTYTEYGIPKFHVMSNRGTGISHEVISTFDVSLAVGTILQIRTVEEW